MCINYEHLLNIIVGVGLIIVIVWNVLSILFWGTLTLTAYRCDKKDWWLFGWVTPLTCVVAIFIYITC